MKVLLDSGANFWAFDQHDTQMKILDQHNPISVLEPSGNSIKSIAEATYDHMLPMLPKGTSNGHVMPLGQRDTQSHHTRNLLMQDARYSWEPKMPRYFTKAT